MREQFGVSSDNSILKHLKALEEKGFLEKDDTPRGIKVLASVRARLEGAVNSVSLPLLGAIPAGGPVLSEEYVQKWVNVGSDIVKEPDGSFLLAVTGNSMIDAGIFEGDLAVVDSKRSPKDGDIVIALVDGDNTLKRFVKQNGKVYLKAENKDYSDIYPENELTVQGVVAAIIRQY